MKQEVKQLALQKIHGRAGLGTPGSVNAGTSLSPVPESNLFSFSGLKAPELFGPFVL